MAYTPNTGHALYSNLIELFGVQSGALVSLKTARTFTVDGSAGFGSGTWGEHFSTHGAGYVDHGATFSPTLTVDTYTVTNYTVVTVINSSGSNEGSQSLSRTAGAKGRSPGLASGKITGMRGATGATALGTTNHMLAYCRIGETSYKLYVDNGTLDFSTASAGTDYNDPTTGFDLIGATVGGSSCNLDIVWIAVFNKELSQAEIQSLYGSLGASNAFGLVAGASTNGTASGTPDTLDLIAPTASASGTGGANGSASGSPSPASITAPAATATGTTAGSGTITTPALKNNTGTILASISGWTVNVYNASTGALVVQKTGLTTSAVGVLTVTDAAIATGTTYAYEPVHATYGRRLPTGAAS